MCGITGIYTFTESPLKYVNKVKNSLQKQILRGPDSQAIFEGKNCILGHARLSIIDTSTAGNQPFTDNSGRYTIVFNGEFFNYQEFYKELQNDGVEFRSTSDTEVLLYLYIKYGKDCINKINGFFAFAIYDSHLTTLSIVRDRMGIKPLYVIHNEMFFAFSSQLNGLMEYPFKREINQTALFSYLQLNYIPANQSILQNVTQVNPGTCLVIHSDHSIISEPYYTLPLYSKGNTNISYNDAQTQLIDILDDSVKKRLISDVPLGTFLSGGIDSSIISTLANRHVDKLKTFSIGFTENSYFDETYYANLVAKKLQTEHTVIPISNKEFSDTIMSVLESIDEPFADSSAIAVYVLSKYVKPHVTVALSGDGADEIFAGYNKHKAHYNLLNKGIVNFCVSKTYPILKHFPQSRNNKITNTFRKIQRYGEGLTLSNSEAYWKWCSIQSENNAQNIMKHAYNASEYNHIKQHVLQHFSKNSTINDILYADQLLVLPNDMLVKVDRMSMAHSLEVRSPFLDYRVIEFANSLPQDYKINSKLKKRILQDSFRNDLPLELYNRPKKGFEVPLHEWCTTILTDIISELLNQKFIEEQNIFTCESIKILLKKLHSHNPGDSASQVWAIIVFQFWWKKYMNNNLTE